MILIHDLYDISQAFIGMRADIKYDKNIFILQNIIKVLRSNNSYEPNQIRNTLAEIPDLDREKWEYVYHQNLYVYHSPLKNQKIINILIKSCEELIIALQSKNFDSAWDLVDTIHCLPDIIAENKFSITKSYWKSHVKYYRDKWDKNFLKDEQKALKRKLYILEVGI